MGALRLRARAVGAVAAPIYPSSTPAECAYILEHANAVGCLVEDATQLRRRSKASSSEHVYERERLDELRALGREHAGREPGALERAREQIGDDDLFTFIYTSGTTGPPKGCMILNRNYYDMVGTIDEIEDFFLPTDVMLLYLPLAHNFGRLMHLLGAHLGFTIAFLADPRRIGDVMPQVRPTILPTVPRVSRRCTRRSRELRERHGRQAAAGRLGARRRRGGERPPPARASRSRAASPSSTASPTGSSTRR